jgi:hypothetical protein
MIGDLLPTLARAQKDSIAQLQHSIQSGLIPSYIGIPLLEQKIQQRQQAQALLMGQQQQGQPPIAQQVMQQANQVTQPPQAPQMPQQMPPQQMAQTPQGPQGIDAAQSNMPTAYAGGGIVAFADNEDQPVSRYMPATRQYDDSYVPTDRESYRKTGFLDWLIPPQEKPEGMSDEEYEKIKKPAFTAPKAGPLAPPTQAAPGSRRETAPAPGAGSVSPPPVVTEKKPEEPKKEPELKVERTPSKPALGPSQIFGGSPTDNIISDLMKKRETSEEGLKQLILGDEKDRAKQLKIQSLLKIMQGGLKAAGGTSPYAMANIGPAAAETAGGIGELYAQQEADKQKRVGQLVALGLKGQELDAELAKLGITKDYYDAHKELFRAQAYKYMHPTATAGMPKGIPFESMRKVEQEYEGYLTNPKTILASPLARLIPPETDPQNGWIRKGLGTNPGTPSYDNAMGAVRRIAEQEKNELYRKGYMLGGRSTATSVFGEDQ